MKLLSAVSLPLRLALMTAGTIGIVAGLLVGLAETLVFAGLIWWLWDAGAFAWLKAFAITLAGESLGRIF